MAPIPARTMRNGGKAIARSDLTFIETGLETMADMVTMEDTVADININRPIVRASCVAMIRGTVNMAGTTTAVATMAVFHSLGNQLVIDASDSS